MTFCMTKDRRRSLQGDEKLASQKELELNESFVLASIDNVLTQNTHAVFT